MHFSNMLSILVVTLQLGDKKPHIGAMIVQWEKDGVLVC